MLEPYRTFHIAGSSEALPETLLGRATQWCPTGTIFFIRPKRSVIELTRFRLASLRFDDPGVAAWLGLELARLIVDSCYEDLVSERDERRRLPHHRT